VAKRKLISDGMPLAPLVLTIRQSTDRVSLTAFEARSMGGAPGGAGPSIARTPQAWSMG
jgi:hypothetical protein